MKKILLLLALFTCSCYAAHEDNSLESIDTIDFPENSFQLDLNALSPTSPFFAELIKETTDAAHTAIQNANQAIQNADKVIQTYQNMQTAEDANQAIEDANQAIENANKIIQKERRKAEENKKKREKKREKQREKQKSRKEEEDAMAASAATPAPKLPIIIGMSDLARKMQELAFEAEKNGENVIIKAEYGAGKSIVVEFTPEELIPYKNNPQKLEDIYYTKFNSYPEIENERKVLDLAKQRLRQKTGKGKF